MDFNEILLPVLVFLGLGALMGVRLAVASRAFAVKTDERVEKIAEILPGANWRRLRLRRLPRTCRGDCRGQGEMLRLRGGRRRGRRRDCRSDGHGGGKPRPHESAGHVLRNG